MLFESNLAGDRRYAVLWLLGIALLIAACSGDNQSAEDMTPTLNATVPPTLAVTAAPLAAEITPEAVEPTEIHIWWPDTIAPPGNSDASALLTSQIEGFQTARADVLVSSRLKKIDGAGGIITSLRSASAVAPGALPDLTLIRREDLAAAAQAGLIQPLEGLVSSAILGDLYTSALALGQVNGELYGLPYALQVQHVAYQGESAADDLTWRLEDVLARDISFVFPAAGRSGGIGDVFLLQYLAAGGSLLEDGTLSLNADALHDTLAFYEQGVRTGTISSSVLDYNSAIVYQDQLADGVIDAGLVTSTGYLDLLASGVDLQPAPIPTVSGQPVTVLSGWMWVLVTNDANRQALVADFLSWMLDAERQGQYTHAVHLLPSQRTALRQWDETGYVEFLSGLLTNARLPLPEGAGGTVSRALQNALTAVLSGQATADEATAAVVQQLTS